MPPLSRVSEERRCLQKFLDDGKKQILRFENGKFSFKTGPGVMLFETYGSLLNLLPQCVDEPNEIWMSCAVPKCDYKLKVYTPICYLGNCIKNSQTHHPYLLTDEDRKDVVRTDQTTSKRPRTENDAVTK
jgi:hypothetical protein